MHDALVLKVPKYAVLAKQHDAELVDELHYVARRMVESAIHHQPLGKTDLNFFRDVGRERARARFSPDDLRAGMQLAYLAGASDVSVLADTSNHVDVTTYFAHATRELGQLARVADVACAAALAEMDGGKLGMGLLVRHLLEGSSPDATAAALGVTLPAGYLLLLCRPRPYGSRQKIHPMVAERLLARVPGALCQLRARSEELLLLLPITEDTLRTVRATGSDLTAELAAIMGNLHVLESVAASPQAVPAAYAEAKNSIALIAAMPDAENRPYHVNELLIESTISAQPALRRKLAGLLEPLDQGKDLRRTLEILFACGLDREKTAKRLYIHRRTLTYRLLRIRTLTGFDPAAAHGIQVLRCALTAARLPASLQDAT
ncbi:helix-turn-helix domain-containing protein [Fodinicola feengrottensis]